MLPWLKRDSNVSITLKVGDLLLGKVTFRKLLFTEAEHWSS